MNTIHIAEKLKNANFSEEQAKVLAGFIDHRNQSLADKSDIRQTQILMFAGFTVMGIGFNYLLTAINNNATLINTLIAKLN